MCHSEWKKPDTNATYSVTPCIQSLNSDNTNLWSSKSDSHWEANLTGREHGKSNHPKTLDSNEISHILGGGWHLGQRQQNWVSCMLVWLLAWGRVTPATCRTATTEVNSRHIASLENEMAEIALTAEAGKGGESQLHLLWIHFIQTFP